MGYRIFTFGPYARHLKFSVTNEIKIHTLNSHEKGFIAESISDRFTKDILKIIYKTAYTINIKNKYLKK